MNEKNKQNRHVPMVEENPKLTEGTAAVKPSSWKRLMARKWVFPAAYMAAAAIILTIMWVYQDSGKVAISDKDMGLTTTAANSGQNNLDTLGIQPDVLAVTAGAETMQWPLEDRNAVKVAKPFYDSKATNDQKLAAMVQYEHTFTPHMGISFVREDGQSFNVLAAMSGKVTRVERLPIVGNLVEITHSNGWVTVYQSLSDVIVTKDAQVKKGEQIAKAGRNELEKDMGVHLHFEVHQDDQPVNPELFISAK